eukprot:744014-Amphidinium_carterae.1
MGTLETSPDSSTLSEKPQESETFLLKIPGKETLFLLMFPGCFQAVSGFVLGVESWVKHLLRSVACGGPHRNAN